MSILPLLPVDCNPSVATRAAGIQQFAHFYRRGQRYWLQQMFSPSPLLTRCRVAAEAQLRTMALLIVPQQVTALSLLTGVLPAFHAGLLSRPSPAAAGGRGFFHFKRQATSRPVHDAVVHQGIAAAGCQPAS